MTAPAWSTTPPSEPAGSTAFIGVLILVGLAGCSSVLHTVSPTPLLPYQVSVAGAVAIEDQFEDPLCDAQNTSPLEAISDVLAFPWTFLMTVVAFEGSLGWGLVDAVSDPTQRIDFAHRFEQIRQWVPVYFSGVELRLDGAQPQSEPSCP